MKVNAISKTKTGKEVVVATFENSTIEQARNSGLLRAMDFDGRLEVVKE